LAANLVARLAQVADETPASTDDGKLAGDAAEQRAAEEQAAEEQVAEEQVAEERAADVEPRLDPEVEARRRAALAHVRTFGDAALRSKAREVVTFDQALADEIARMSRLMEDALGVGLAATQLGVMHRVLVYRVGLDAPFVVVVNPQLDWASDEKEVAEEACLSLPGVAVDVERPVHVRVNARDEHGEPILVEGSGLEARVIQHEMDHLDGVLILDHADREQRKEAMRLLREGGGSWPEPRREVFAPSPA
jgi:peptide deformylase